RYPTPKDLEPAQGDDQELLERKRQWKIKLKDDPPRRPLVLGICLVGDVVDFSYHENIKVGEGGIVQPDQFLEKEDDYSGKAHLFLTQDYRSFPVGYKTVSKLEDRGDSFGGTHFTPHMFAEPVRRSTHRNQKNPLKKTPLYPRKTAIVAGNDAVVAHLTQRTGVDFSGMSTPQGIYLRLLPGLITNE
ncbi:MAG: hypothetical protein ABIH34_04695, partial [Nanoarchaeota archaeon]